MKNTMKKALAFLLTLALAVPMFAVAANAKIVTETETVEIDITEDFNAATAVGEASPYTFTTASGWTGKSETDAIGGLVVGDENGQLKYTFSSASASRYQVHAPAALKGVDTYTITGQFQVTANSKGYLRVFLSSDAVKNAGENNICLDLRSGTNYTTYWFGDSAIRACDLKMTDVIGFKCVRAGTSFSVTYYPLAEGIESSKAVTLSITVPAVTATSLPGLRFQAGQAENVGTSVIVDNLVIDASYEKTTSVFVPETDIVPEGWATVEEDFADADTNFEVRVENATNGTGTAKVADGKVSYKIATNACDIITAPDSFAADVFTFSGDMNIGEVYQGTEYVRIHIRPFKNDFSYSVIIHLAANSAASSYITFLQKSGAGLAGGKISNLTNYIGKDVQYQYSRYGNELSFSIWVKGQYDTTVQTITYAIDDAAYMEKLGTPQIRFQAPGNLSVTSNTTISMDNLYLENTVGKINVVGAQASIETDAADERFAVRFIATIDSRDYLKAGFAIKATTADNTVKEWSLDTCTAYDSIIANDAAGTAKYTAQDLGGKYLIAVTIDNIPKSVGSVTFDLSAFCGDAANTFTSGIVDVVATVNADGTVTLA